MVLLVQKIVAQEATAEDFQQLGELSLENHPLENEIFVAVEQIGSDVP